MTPHLWLRLANFILKLLEIGSDACASDAYASDASASDASASDASASDAGAADAGASAKVGRKTVIRVAMAPTR